MMIEHEETSYMSHRERSDSETHVEAVAKRLDEADRARQEALAAMHPLCPQDGQPGDYIGISGAYGSTRLAFICPSGDRFTYDPDTQETRLIRPERWGYIRLESLDLLHSPATSGRLVTPEVASHE